MLLPWKRENPPAPQAAPQAKDDDDYLQELLAIRAELEAPGATLDEAARALGSKDAAFAFVRDRIAHASYEGVWGGDEGTLRTRTGNGADRSLLLAALLERLGFEIQLAASDLPADANPPAMRDEIPPALLDRVRKVSANLPDVLPTEAASEIDASVALLRRLVPDRAFDAVAKTSERQALPRPERTWVWVRARAKGADRWEDLDPVFPGRPRPGTVREFARTPSEIAVSLVVIDADGKTRRLAEWSGPTPRAIGHDVFFGFMPSSPLQEVAEGLDPSKIHAWHAVLQVGADTVRGGAFTPEGAVLRVSGNEMLLNDTPALTLDGSGAPQFEAVPIRSLAVSRVDARDYPRVRVSLAVSPERKPSWFHGHFDVRQGGTRLPARIESGHVEPQPVLLVIDRSNSMGEGRRTELAKEAARAFVEGLSPDQPVGFLAFAGEPKLIVKPARLSEIRETLLREIAELGLAGGTAIPEALDLAYRSLERPGTIVFLTDGQDGRQEHLVWFRSMIDQYGKDHPIYNERALAREEKKYRETMDAAERLVSSGRHRLIPVGIGTADDATLGRLAELSKSIYVRVKEGREDLTEILAGIGRELGGQVEISFVDPGPAKAGDVRTVQIRLEGFSGALDAAFQVPDGPRAVSPGMRFIVRTQSSDGVLESDERILADRELGADPWMPVSMHHLGFLVAPWPERIRLARKIEALIVRHLREVRREVSHENHGLEYRTGAMASALLREVPSAASPKPALWTGPTLILVSEYVARPAEDFVRRTVLDTLRLGRGPDDAATQGDLARWGIVLGSVEARLLGAKSVNAQMIEREREIRVHAKAPPGTRLLVGEVGWALFPAGEVAPFLTRPRPTKGASIEEIAREFKFARKLIELYCKMSSSHVSMKAPFQGLCTFFDRILRLYCFATVMLAQIDPAKVQEYDPQKAAKRAAEL